MKITRILTLIMVMLVPATFQPLQASPLMAAAQGAALKVKSEQQAVSLAKGKYGGKVLKVESARVNGNPGYRVKLVTSDGRVMHVKIDAATGRIQGD
ncbi:PepSY domain-containing protein [Shewanella corallii]|uniref:PepSY domain-containing protein n=2 Tax=Shewanella TaxID=22 RepID=A0ABT0N414_9GAMM|nr:MULTISPECIES: PepSY domain-containing protein [Shewanella]MCL1036314.1 PepSY domain-containing protein [Shewanella submarina]MCL2912920.1 PepSY domain-containing protein [Shewanella corallii]